MDKGRIFTFAIVGFAIVILIAGILYIAGRISLSTNPLFTVEVPRHKYELYDNRELEFSLQEAVRTVNYDF